MNVEQRYCKECNLPVGKGIQKCDECKNKVRQKYKSYKRVANPKVKLITIEEELLLKECINKGITITGDIIKELKENGIKRSQGFIIKHLKRLGIYQYPNMDLVIFNRDNDKEAREKRIQIAESKGFSTLNNDNRRKSKVKCNKCNTIITYSTMISNDCYVCKTKQRIEERIKTNSEIRDNNNSARIKEYTSRIERLKEFIHSDRYKEYTNWKETPVIKEYTFYTSVNSIEYRDKDLTYKIQSINYYHYKSSSKCPDKPNKKGLKICNQCKEHKPIKEFNTNSKQSNGCKECAKEYRRINYLPNEILKQRERYKTDPVYKLDSICRTYIYGALKGKPKTRRTKEIIGVTPFELKQYIEDRFESWMSWDNWGIGEGMWQVQHIIPRDFAINEKEIYLINHYKNLIPMCATANGILKNRIVKEQLNEWHNTDKGIQKIIKRNKSNIITEWELKRVLPIIVREIDTNKIKQSEQKLTKWFAYE
jgi:hypothetical protein